MNDMTYFLYTVYQCSEKVTGHTYVRVPLIWSIAIVTLVYYAQLVRKRSTHACGPCRAEDVHYALHIGGLCSPFAPYKAGRRTWPDLPPASKGPPHLFPTSQASRGVSNEQMGIHQKYLNVPGCPYLPGYLRG